MRRRPFPDYLLLILTAAAVAVPVATWAGFWSHLRLAWRFGQPGHIHDLVIDCVCIAVVSGVTGLAACAVAYWLGIWIPHPWGRTRDPDYDDGPTAP